MAALWLDKVRAGNEAHDEFSLAMADLSHYEKRNVPHQLPTCFLPKRRGTLSPVGYRDAEPSGNVTKM
jgi:hypothetical protein